MTLTSLIDEYSIKFILLCQFPLLQKCFIVNGNFVLFCFQFYFYGTCTVDLPNLLTILGRGLIRNCFTVSRKNFPSLVFTVPCSLLTVKDDGDWSLRSSIIWSVRRVGG